MTNKAKNRIATPFTQTFGTMNVNDGISDHMITSHSTATGDFEAKVVGIVLASSDGSEHIQVGGFSVSTKPDFYPSSNPLGYICILTSRENAVGMKDPIMEPFADMPLPNSPTYKNCLRALFPKYFFKLRSGHTYEPVYVGSSVVVGYTNNEIGGPGHFIRSLEMTNTPPILSSAESSGSPIVYHATGTSVVPVNTGDLGKTPEGQPETVTYGRDKLKNLTPDVKRRLFLLANAEVGLMGLPGFVAFFETVSNRAAIQGVTIDQLIKQTAYYQPIKRRLPGGGLESWDVMYERLENKHGKSVNRKIQTYETALATVAAGSNITGGATQNSSAGVAASVRKGGYDSDQSTIIKIPAQKGETYYSKTYEQKKLKKYGIRN